MTEPELNKWLDDGPCDFKITSRNPHEVIVQFFPKPNEADKATNAKLLNRAYSQ